MDASLPNALLSRLSDFVAAQMGLHFPEERWADLERGLQAAAVEFGFADAASCAEWLLAAPLTKPQIEVLARDLTVGETYFFREKTSWDALAGAVLPGLDPGARRRRAAPAVMVRGLLHGGGTGVSLAILLQRLIPDWREWNLTILATDLNPHFLRKAAAGVFREWSFRDAPDWLKAGHFKPTAAGDWEIVPAARRMVTFAPLNLAKDVYPSLGNNTNAMDVILCRNVLMYFAPDAAGQTLQKFHHTLVEDGWLIVSPSEASFVSSSQFQTVNYPGAIFHQKKSASAPPAGVNAAVEWESTPLVPRPRAPAPAARPSHAAARVFYEQGRYEEAARQLLTDAAVQPLEPSACTLLARALANQGRLTEALGWCDRAVAAGQLDPAAHYLRATVLQEQGAWDEAAHSLRRALSLDRDFVLAHFDLGHLALRRGRVPEAHREMAHALRLLRRQRPNDPVPESEGLTAGRLAEIIKSQMESEAAP